jgi:hypothetical protein
MPVAQRAGHLVFDDDLVLDQKAGGIFASDHVVIKDDDTPLPDDAALAHLVSKSVLVNVFNEPMTERIGTLKAHPMIRSVAGSNGRPSPASICIPFIRLKNPVLASVPRPDGAQMSYIANQSNGIAPDGPTTTIASRAIG